MINDEGFFNKAPLEVEYRTPGNRLEAVSRTLGQQIVIPRAVYIVDSYIYFDRKTGDFKRVRKAGYVEDGGQPSDFKYQEQWKFHPFGEHPVEMKRRITEGEYSDSLGDGQALVVVRGLRKEMWITENGPSIEKDEGGLHICFDSPEGLGDWTEFEIEIYNFNYLTPEERAGKRDEAKRMIFGFASRLGLSEADLNNPTYVEQLLKRRGTQNL